MKEESLIKVENLSKRFCRKLRLALEYGAKDLFAEIVGRPHGGSLSYSANSNEITLRKDEFWAVKDINFEVYRGDCLALIGANGAGKTTLLRMINGLIKPDTGKITIRGKVGAIIALGIGFNPLLTGRENYFLCSAVLGVSRLSAKKLLKEVFEFAELFDFIDSPVQSYSSGMQVRLGFAIASFLEVDVLILDEILAVGDQNFRIKCYKKIDELRSKTATIFVSHSTEQIARISNKALYMKKGVGKILSVDEGLLKYLDDSAIDKKFSSSNQEIKYKKNFLFKKIHFKDTKEGINFVISLDLDKLEKDILRKQIWIRFLVLESISGNVVGTLKTEPICNEMQKLPKLSIEAEKLMLRNGLYKFHGAIYSEKNNSLEYLEIDFADFQVKNSFIAESSCCGYLRVN